MKRTFTSQAEFDSWHAQAATAAGLPIVGRNAKTGVLQPEKQQTIAYTSVGPAKVDDEGNVIDPTLVAVVAADDLARRGLTDGLIRADLLTEAELAEIAGHYFAWDSSTAYEVDDLASHNGLVYKCLQAHTAQVDWTPDVVPALWRVAAPGGVIPEWVQPTGAHNAYQTGDRVTFEGQVYESTIDSNVWSPTAYPAGWQLV